LKNNLKKVSIAGIALLLMFALSIGAVIGTLLRRNEIELSNNVATIVMPSTDIIEIASQSGRENVDILAEFREMGLAAVSVVEYTPEEYAATHPGVFADTVSKFQTNLSMYNALPKVLRNSIDNGDFLSYDMVFCISDGAVYDELIDNLLRRYPENCIHAVESDEANYIILSDGVARNYNEIGIAYDEDMIAAAHEAKINILLRPRNFEIDPGMLVDAYDYYLDQYSASFPVLLVGSSDLLGYPSALDKLQTLLEKRDMVVGLVEAATQLQHISIAGASGVINAMDGRMVRVFSMWDFVRSRFGVYGYTGCEEITNTVERAILERNVRVVVTKSFVDPAVSTISEDFTKVVTDMDMYRDYFATLSERCSERTVNIGTTPTVLEHNESKWYVNALLYLGISAAIATLIFTVFDFRPIFKTMIVILGMIGAVGVAYAMPSSGKAYGALAASVTYTCLGIYFACRAMYRARTIVESGFKRALRILGVTAGSIAVAMIGGLFVASIMSSSEYLNEREIFRGVKASQILPLLYAAFICLKTFGYRSDELKPKLLPNIERLANEKVSFWMAAIAVVIAAILFLYISRTGHETDVQPSDIEMIFRNYLEKYLYSRPRLKEFLFATPLYCLAMWLNHMRQHKIFDWMGVCAFAVGLASTSNTYCHLRTPLNLAVMRTVIAYPFGIILGACLCIAAVIIIKIVKSNYFKGRIRAWRE